MGKLAHEDIFDFMKIEDVLSMFFVILFEGIKSDILKGVWA